MSRIFISYRREDSQGHAGRLYDSLVNRYGESDVFMDVDTIQPGIDFVEALEDAVAKASILIAIIGPRWLSISDDDGSRRLDDPGDYVRREIATALDRNIRVIPILVAGATMPRAEDLPEGLKGLARRNAKRLDHDGWRNDVESLMATLQSRKRPEESERRIGQKSALDDPELWTPFPVNSSPALPTDFTSVESRPQSKFMPLRRAVIVIVTLWCGLYLGTILVDAGKATFGDWLFLGLSLALAAHLVKTTWATNGPWKYFGYALVATFVFGLTAVLAAY